LEHTETCGIGVLKDHVGLPGNLCKRLLLSGADILSISYIRNDDIETRFH